MINYQLGLLIAIIAFTYSYLLTRPNALFCGLYNFLDIKLNAKRDGLGPHWLFMILIHCEKCIAGQAALWIYLYLNWQTYIYNPNFETAFYHVAFTCYCILLAAVIKEIYTKHIDK